MGLVSQNAGHAIPFFPVLLYVQRNGGRRDRRRSSICAPPAGRLQAKA
jgi:hypothetical protein